VSRQRGCDSERKDGGWWDWRVAVTDLTGGVDDVALIFGTFVVDALREGAFYGRVIGFDKVVVDELYDQG
jgi:hypothetical protein